MPEATEAVVLPKHECGCGAEVVTGRKPCPLFGRVMSGRAWEICSGKCPASRPINPSYRLRKLSKWYRGYLGVEPPEIIVAEQVQRKRPCIHLGEPTGDLKACGSCQGEDGKVKTRFKVFLCNHPAHTDTTIPDCLFCPHYQAKIPPLPPPCDPVEPPGDKQCLGCAVAYLSLPPAPMTKRQRQRWSKRKNVHEAHLLGLEHFAANIGPYPGGHEGRGIVMACGGDYFASGWAAVHQLRALGCTLPIEWWYLGHAEMDTRMRQLAESIGVTCINAHDFPRPRMLSGWELKPFAILHSRFREVLSLDADNIPAQDPTFLFEHPDYKFFGSVFWPDIPPPGGREEWIPAPAWEAAGMTYSDCQAFESGQVLVDKSRCWSAINVTMWLNEHSDRYYLVVYGDKDTFLLGWRYTSTGYAQAPPAQPVGYGIAQHDFAGKLLFQHRCQGKIRLGSRTDDQAVNESLERLTQLWSGRAWVYADQSAEEIGIAESIPRVYQYSRAGHGTRPLELLPRGGIGKGAAARETHWTLRLMPEPTLIISGGAVATMFLKREGEVWRGRWTRHEGTEASLS